MRWRFLFWSLAALLLPHGPACAQDWSLRPLIGGLPADSGFSLGAEVRRTRLIGPVDARIKAIGSVKKYEFLQVAFEVPEFITPWLSMSVSGRYRNYPQEDFWGLGPNTQKEQRSNYLFEDADTTATLTASFHRLSTGISGGYVRINTGPGRDERFPSVPDNIQAGPRYKHAGLFVEYNRLDDNADPHSGGKYAFRWTTFSTTFQRYEVDLREFVPITANDRVGFRLQTVFTDPPSTAVVPFFMLPTAGGTDTVRGFDQYRFRDYDALVLNAEYRRPVSSFLDAVAFVDAGRVFSHARDLGLKDLHVSPGFGARIKLGKRVFFGVDLAFSGEGHKLWLRSDHMF